MEVINQETLRPPINFIKEGIKIGLINGAIALLLMYGSYFAGLERFVSIQTYSRYIPYMMVVLIIYGLQLREKNGGILSFKEALQYSFMSYVIVELIIGAGAYVLFNLVDKNLTQTTFDFAIAKLKKNGMSADEIKKALGTVEEQKTTFKTVLLGMGYSLILDFIASFVVSFIIRREKPAI